MTNLNEYDRTLEEIMEPFKDNEQYYDSSFKQLVSPEEHFTDIEFEECDFTECDFSGVSFFGCKFINCVFSGCNLSLINLSNSRVFGTEFRDCKLVGIDWTKADWPSYHIDHELKFQRCIMNDSSFFGLILNELNLDECKLHDIDFREGNFDHSSMRYCDFTNSLFMRTSIQNTDFSESIAYNINVLDNQIKGAKFSRFEALNLLESIGVELVD